MEKRVIYMSLVFIYILTLLLPETEAFMRRSFLLR
jgi:hypothetical protein